MKIAGLDKCNLKGSKYFYKEERPKWAWHVIINASLINVHRCYAVCSTVHTTTHNLNINSLMIVCTCFNLPSKRLESRLSTRPRMRSTLCGMISPSLTFSITIFIFRHLICDAVLWEATDYTPTSNTRPPNTGTAGSPPRKNPSPQALLHSRLEPFVFGGSAINRTINEDNQRP